MMFKAKSSLLPNNVQDRFKTQAEEKKLYTEELGLHRASF